MELGEGLPSHVSQNGLTTPQNGKEHATASKDGQFKTPVGLPKPVFKEEPTSFSTKKVTESLLGCSQCSFRSAPLLACARLRVRRPRLARPSRESLSAGQTS